MELDEGGSENYSSDSSSHLDLMKHARSTSVKSGFVETTPDVEKLNSQRPSDHEASTPRSSSIPSSSSLNYQNMVLQALMKTTTTLVGSSPGLLHFYGEEAIQIPSVKKEENAETSTWNEASYHIAEAKRRRKPDMMRTSAGEESDSQEDFPLPENPTSEQKALRTRRLNRWRGTKARYLTSNRRALKKTAYVIHVDASSKPKGIHRHVWKKVVRGQCSRLDPSMDNINHHPKQVVDSIWHALEREWEFEGFAHKAREMFEKTATKYMRNRKMQLKYKCLKAKKGEKPSDISETHWKKIQGIVDKSSKLQDASKSSSRGLEAKIIRSIDVPSGEHHLLEAKVGINRDKLVENTGKIRKTVAVDGIEDLKSSEKTTEQGNERNELKKISDYCTKAGEYVASEEEDVDSQIKNLKQQLQWLERSKKTEEFTSEKLTDVVLNVTDCKGTVDEVRRASGTMKENVTPLKGTAEKKATPYSGVKGNGMW